jgi:predicted amidohydrolase YtcJ
VIRRRAGSQEPSGVLEEIAFFGALIKVFPKLTEAQTVAMIEEGQNLYLKFGYTTVQDGRATLASVHTAIAAARAGKLKVDIVSYSDNPLTIERVQLADLTVVETIKEGKTVYRAQQ